MAADLTTIVLVAVGGTSICGALAWRQAARHRRKMLLIRRLASPMPDRRARAGIELVDLGLSRVARPLLAHLVVEGDERVRRDIALAVARRQWEPSGSTPVSELRQWTRAELEHQGFDVIAFGPAFTRLSDMGGPRLPERDPDAGFDAAGAGAPATEAAADPDASEEGPHELHWTPTPVHDVVPPMVDGAEAPTSAAPISEEQEGATARVAAPRGS
jgi:hypothetical protein